MKYIQGIKVASVLQFAGHQFGTTLQDYETEILNPNTLSEFQ